MVHLSLARWAAPAALLLALSACGGQAAEGRPSTADLESAIERTAPAGAPLQPAVVHCQASALQSSDLSDAGLRSYISGKAYDLTRKEKESLAVGGELWQKLQTCQQNN